MLKIITILISTICLHLCHEANAQVETPDQDAVYLISNPKKARWSYIETDSKGKHIATIYNSVDSIEGDGVNGSIKVRVEEIPVASPKDSIKSFMFYRFKDGEFMVDLYALFEESIFEGKLDSLVRKSIKEKYTDLPEEKENEVIESVKSEFINTSGEIRGIPRYPKVGELPDYEFLCKFSIMSMKVLGKERKIVGRETIQTEAGSFDCFVMEETISTKAMMITDVEKTKSWYAYGIGLVKEITYDKKGNLISTMILNEVSR